MAIMKSLTIGGFMGEIPSKTSDLTNDSGFVDAAGAAAAAPVQSVNSKTGAVVLDASDVGAATPADLIALLPVDTASDAIAAFPDGADDLPVLALKVGIQPVQSGSGTPAPDNVRPISGHTQAVIKRTGKNILPTWVGVSNVNGLTSEVNADGSVRIHGTATGAGGYISGRITFANPITWNYGTISFSTNLPGRIRVFKKDKNGTTIGSLDIQQNDSSYTFSSVYNLQGAYSVEMYMVTTANTAYDFTIYPQLEAGTTATTYEKYISPTVITVDLDGTRYGGTLDVLTGVLTVTWATLDMGSLEWRSGYQGFFTLGLLSLMNWADANTVQRIMSSSFNWMPYSTRVNGCLMTEATSHVVIAVDQNYSDPDAFSASVAGQTLCYELASPFTVQLDANTLSTWLGSNSIWADTYGDTSVTYRANIQKYIQKLVGA